MTGVTQILSQIEQGDPSAADQLLPLVYEELCKLAAAKLAKEKPGQTLQATALVHDAFIRLVDAEHVREWNSRGHFFSAAAEAMRRILVERARRRGAWQRRGLGHRVTLDENDVVLLSPTFDLLGFDEALSELQQHDAQAAEFVKLRFFAGLTHQEAADSMEVTRRVADRFWRVARAWLSREMSRE